MSAARGRSPASATIASASASASAGGNHEAGLAVGDDLGKSADGARDHRPRPLHGLERDHPETFSERRHDDDRGVLDRSLHRRDEAEEAHRVLEPELARVSLQGGLERPAPGDVEHHVGHTCARLRQRAEEDEVTLDRDEAADAEEARLGPVVRSRAPCRGDPVVDDLEVSLVEALGLREVLGETLRDRDVHVRERADRAIGEPEPAPFPKLVEPVLRREPERDACDGTGELPVDVRVHEVRVEDPRPDTREVRGHLPEGDGVDVRTQADVVERDAASAKRVGELPTRRPRPRGA